MGTIYFGAFSRVLAPANEDFLSKNYTTKPSSISEPICAELDII